MSNQFNELFLKLQGQIIAHRGAPTVAPENTAASFKKAAELGAKWIEFDTQLCKSGDWVIIHDETLERTTNGTGKVSDYTVDELKVLDAGSWFNPYFQGERILTLFEVLKLAVRLGLYCQIEVKASTAPTPKELLNLKQLIEDSHISKTSYVISSFNESVLQGLQKQDKTLALAYSVDNIEADTIDKVLDADYFFLHCDYETLQIEQLTQIMQRKIKILLYTINHPKLARMYFDLGVTAIFSDFPNLLLNFS